MIRTLTAALLLSAALPGQREWRKHVVAEGFVNQTAVAADFTGDGLPDIISNDFKRTILFAAPDWKPVVLHEGLRVIHGAVMDVDGDGDLDFIGAQYNPAVVFWLERPDKPLEQPWTFHLIDDFAGGGVNGVHGLMTGDIDGDGKPDLAASSGLAGGNFPDSIVWFKVPPNPRRAPAWIRNVAGKGDAPGFAHYVAGGDVDGDGRNDIASAAKFPPDGNWFAWWRQPAQAGAAWAKQVIARNHEGATNIVIADFNGDGKQDFAASNGHGHGIFWFEAPDWKQRTVDSLIGGPHALAAGDIDRDGDIDLATCAKNSLKCAWYENDGRGNFTAHVLDEDQASYDVRLVDVDADGDLDLLVAGQESRNVVWFENPGPRAAGLYRRFCAGCHNSGTARIPLTTALQNMSREAILRSMESGVMKEQAAGMTSREKAMVAEWLARPRQLLNDVVRGCVAGDKFERGGAEWNGWGGAGHSNWRNAPASGLSRDDVPKLELAWAFGFQGDTVAFAHPSVSGGWLFVGSRSGKVTALDAKTGCTHWTIQADGPVRTAPVIDERNRLYIGDLLGQLYALDGSTGRILWKTRIDAHPHARITAAPALHEGRLYVTVASQEEGIASDPKYPCCTFRGSVAAVDAGTGKVLWKTYMVPDAPKLIGKNAAGVDSYANSGIGVRVTPTLDPAKRALYVTTGENYSPPATSLVNAFVALAMDDGRILWSKQITPGDVWNVACISPDRTNCPFEPGPDANFGMAPMLVEAGPGQRLLIAGQKSGVVTAVDPDRQGEIVWQAPIGKGGLLGGIQWGGATDGRRVYIPLSDYGLTVVGRRQYGNPDPAVGGGLFAMDAATGRVVWKAPPPKCPADRTPCSPAQSAAATLAGGAVFSGAMDGVLRAYDAETGEVIWSFDTARPFETVNGVAARGGAMDGAGPAVADGMVYVTSGYSIFGGMPGNVLLAFKPQ